MLFIEYVRLITYAFVIAFGQVTYGTCEITGNYRVAEFVGGRAAASLAHLHMDGAMGGQMRYSTFGKRLVLSRTVQGIFHAGLLLRWVIDGRAHFRVRRHRPTNMRIQVNQESNGQD